MNYEEVHALMKTHHTNVAGKRGALSKVDPNKKFLCNKTWLHTLTESGYGLKVFGNEIITWDPTQVVIDDKTWFSRTTFDRLNQYMPKGFSVHGERVPYKLGVIAFVTTPDGVYPWDMPMAFAYDGIALYAAEDAGPYYTNKALAAYRGIREYVGEYLDRLYRGQLDNTLVDVASSTQVAEVILSKVYTTFLLPSLVSSKVDARLMNCLMRVGICGTRTAKNAHERALQTELALDVGLTSGDVTVDSRWLRTHLRVELTRQLIEGLGFSFNEWNRR